MRQATKTMTVRLGEETYEEFMAVLDGIGLDFTSAVRSFIKQTVREQGLPFIDWDLPPFCSPSLNSQFSFRLCYSASYARNAAISRKADTASS